VTPLLMKPRLDSSSPGNYRPIFNLSAISEVLQRLTLTRLRPHLLNSASFSQYQSAYRKEHSTGNCTTGRPGRGLHSCWWQASHSSDRPRLVGRLRHHRPRGPAPAPAVQVQCDSHTANVDPLLPQSRTQYVKLGQHQSPTVRLHVGVPIGPFSVPCCLRYTVAQWLILLQATVSQHHQYADDTQLRLAIHAKQHIRQTGRSFPVYRWR